jgi:hypothetical protein
VLQQTGAVLGAIRAFVVWAEIRATNRSAEGRNIAGHGADIDTLTVSTTSSNYGRRTYIREHIWFIFPLEELTDLAV